MLPLSNEEVAFHPAILFVFVDCSPYLVGYYEKLGFRRYAPHFSYDEMGTISGRCASCPPTTVALGPKWDPTWTQVLGCLAVSCRRMVGAVGLEPTTSTV